MAQDGGVPDPSVVIETMTPPGVEQTQDEQIVTEHARDRDDDASGR